jgi:hypothetical protein
MHPPLVNRLQDLQTFKCSGTSLFLSSDFLSDQIDDASDRAGARLLCTHDGVF